MTLAVRNTVVSFGSLVAAALVVISAVLGSRLSVMVPAGGNGWPQTWAVWTWQVGENQVHASLAVAWAFALAATVTLGASSRVFRRINSSELYFFLIFLLSLTFETLRTVELYLLYVDVPPVYGVLLTRLIVAARVTGAISLFAAGLYAVGVEYPRIGTMTIVVIVASTVFVSIVPVDTNVVQATLLHRLEGQSSLQIAILALGALTIINYGIAGSRGHRERGGLIALAGACVVAGSQLMWFAPGLIPGTVAAVLLAVGSSIFLLVTRAHLLWY